MQLGSETTQNIKDNESFYISSKGVSTEIPNGAGDLVTEDSLHTIRSPKPLCLIKSVPGGEWPAGDETELWIT